MTKTKILMCIFIAFFYKEVFSQHINVQMNRRLWSNIVYNFTDSILKSKFETDTKSQLLLFVGSYKEALNLSDVSKNVKSKKYLKNDTIEEYYKPVDAKEYILGRAKNEQVIFINECHNIPYHRAFVFQLLPELYKLGYRYFGCETFTNYGTSVVKLGVSNSYMYPIRKTGYYTNEPTFGELLREALQVGYNLFSYEDTSREKLKTKITITSTGDTVLTNDIRDYNYREIAEAKNIKKILDKDPNAKIIILAGYAHIFEKTNDPWIKMAMYFKDYTGKDPLTINQITMLEHSDKKYENIYYKPCKKPVVYINKSNNTLFINPEDSGYYDIELFHPRTIYIKGRPDWYLLNGNKTFIPVKRSYLKNIKYPVLIYAIYLNENIETAIPADIIEVNKKSQKAYLALKKGKYNIFIESVNGKIVSYEQEVE